MQNFSIINPLESFLVVYLVSTKKKSYFACRYFHRKVFPIYSFANIFLFRWIFFPCVHSKNTTICFMHIFFSYRRFWVSLDVCMRKFLDRKKSMRHHGMMYHFLISCFIFSLLIHYIGCIRKSSTTRNG